DAFSGTDPDVQCGVDVPAHSGFDLYADLLGSWLPQRDRRRRGADPRVWTRLRRPRRRRAAEYSGRGCWSAARRSREAGQQLRADEADTADGVRSALRQPHALGTKPLERATDRTDSRLDSARRAGRRDAAVGTAR